MSNKFYLSLFLLVFSGKLLFAQQGQDPQGEIEDVQVEIVKDREIILPPAVRQFDKVPPQQETQKRPEIEYNFSAPQVNLSPLDLRLRPLRIKDEPLRKTYGNYIALGFGNYLTPYFEAFVNSKRENNYTYGAHAKYLSSFKGPVDGKNSGNGTLEADIFGSYFGRTASLSGDLGFRRRNNYFYGYQEGIEVSRDSLEQHFNHIYANGILQGTDTKSDWDYSLSLSLDFLSDALDGQEAQAGAGWLSQYNFSDDAAFVFNASYDFINYSNYLVEGETRHLFKVQPRVKLNVAGISLTAGFNAAYENDTLGSGDDLHFYPYAKGELSITEQWLVYAELGGDVQKNTYTGFTYENAFLGPQNLMFHTNKTFDFTGGIKGKVSQKAGWTGGVSLQAYKNMYFYVNDQQAPAIDFYENTLTRPYWFSVIYDRGTTNVFGAFTELSIMGNEDLYGNIKLQLNSYNTDEVEHAYHKPTWIVDTDVFYQLVDKINLNVNFYALGGVKATADDGNDVTLNPAIDLNLKVDYLLSDRASISARFNNIFGQKYELLQRYPVRGFQAMAGITYNF